MEPASIELSLKAAEAIEAEQQRLEKHHRETVERATYEAELTRRRYEEVDPSNRLVAVQLERRWESSLQIQRKAEEALNRFRHETPKGLTPEQRHSIVELSQDIPRLWQSDAATNVDRQMIVRSLIDRIVVDVRGTTERLAVRIEWAGGFESHHEVRRRVNTFGQLEDSVLIAGRIQHLYDEGYPLSEIARLLNQEGFKPAKGDRFTQTSMGLCVEHCDAWESLRSTVEFSQISVSGELARVLKVKKPTLSGWRRRHWVQARQLGTRWIYWADRDELQRLRRLAAQQPSGSTPTPEELTKPVSKMPSC